MDTKIKETLTEIPPSEAPYRKDRERVLKALSIAWEALERINSIVHDTNPTGNCPQPCAACESKDAMRRIKELGK